MSLFLTLLVFEFSQVIVDMISYPLPKVAPNHGMASYAPAFRYQQGEDQGVTSFAEELLQSYNQRM